MTNVNNIRIMENNLAFEEERRRKKADWYGPLDYDSSVDKFFKTYNEDEMVKKVRATVLGQTEKQYDEELLRTGQVYES